MVSPTVTVASPAVSVPPMTRAATQTTSRTSTEQFSLVKVTAAQLKASVIKPVNDKYSAPGPSLVAAGCDNYDYVGDLNELDSAELASPDIKAASQPIDDYNSTKKVTVPASKIKSKSN